jgi:uncharacterized membrane protein
MDENFVLFITNLIVYIVSGVLLMIMPQLTRKSFLFGVKIPPEEASCIEAEQMKKSYMVVCFFCIKLMLLICVIQFMFWREKTLIATLYMPLFILLIYLAVFIPNWKKALSLKKERRWAVSNSESDDDKFWKLGLFYYNPDDSSKIVKARFGINLSFNYAHLPVKIGLILLLSGFIALYIWLTVTLL